MSLRPPLLPPSPASSPFFIQGFFVLKNIYMIISGNLKMRSLVAQSGIFQARILERWPFPSLGDLPDPGIKPGSPTLQADPLTSAPPGKPLNIRIQSLELQIQVRDFKGGKEARLKEGGGGGRGGERVALQTSPATCRYPGVMGLYPGPPE